MVRGGKQPAGPAAGAVGFVGDHSALAVRRFLLAPIELALSGADQPEPARGILQREGTQPGEGGALCGVYVAGFLIHAENPVFGFLKIPSKICQPHGTVQAGGVVIHSILIAEVDPLSIGAGGQAVFPAGNVSGAAPHGPACQ